MLGKTAGGLFWMFRNLERSENTARLVDAGFRIAQTRAATAQDEWASVLRAAGVYDAFFARHQSIDGAAVIDFLLRDTSHPSSVMSSVDGARNNAKLVRTALTREVWEATNDCWMVIKTLLARPIAQTDLPDVLATIRRQSALVRGALDGTMLRNDIYNFTQVGTFIERADSTARILDVKYYILLPSASFVGSPLDNAQWETILRSVSAQRAYRWLSGGGETNPRQIADLMIFDRRLPRSLAFCSLRISDNLSRIGEQYGERQQSHALVDAQCALFQNSDIGALFEEGLHEFLQSFVNKNNQIGLQIERDYRFYG